MVTIHVFHSSAFEVLGLLFRGKLFAFTMPGRLFAEAAKTTVNESKFVNVLERDGVEMVKMHPLHHKTLRNMLTSSRKPTPDGKNTILRSRSYKLKGRFFPL